MFPFWRRAQGTGPGSARAPAATCRRPTRAQLWHVVLAGLECWVPLQQVTVGQLPWNVASAGPLLLCGSAAACFVHGTHLARACLWPRVSSSLCTSYLGVTGLRVVHRLVACLHHQAALCVACLACAGLSRVFRDSIVCRVVQPTVCVPVAWPSCHPDSLPL